MPDEELPVRYCHGCQQYDTHPRAFDISDADNPALDKLYHYDCVPDNSLNLSDNEHLAYGLSKRKRGAKGPKLREHMTAYAQSLEEAPANQKSAKR